jgi:hypothetical protein
VALRKSAICRQMSEDVPEMSQGVPCLLSRRQPAETGKGRLQAFRRRTGRWDFFSTSECVECVPGIGRWGKAGRW